MRHGTLWDSETPAESEICYFANSVLVHQDILCMFHLGPCDKTLRGIFFAKTNVFFKWANSQPLLIYFWSFSNKQTIQIFTKN